MFLGQKHLKKGITECAGTIRLVISIAKRSSLKLLLKVMMTMMMMKEIPGT
jgi:hypothetical protein